MPRVDRPRCGAVVTMVPWAEPGSRFTRDSESECTWLMSVANRKTVSGFLHVAWRTAGDIVRRVADRLRAAMPSPFDGLAAIGVYRKGHTYPTVVRRTDPKGQLYRSWRLEEPLRLLGLPPPRPGRGRAGSSDRCNT